jgi:hypothetical protein
LFSCHVADPYFRVMVGSNTKVLLKKLEITIGQSQNFRRSETKL